MDIDSSKKNKYFAEKYADTVDGLVLVCNLSLSYDSSIEE